MKKLIPILCIALIFVGCINQQDDPENVVAKGIYVRGQSLLALGLEIGELPSMLTPQSEAVVTNSTRLKEVEFFNNLRGEFVEVAASYPQGGLTISRLPMMILQGFSKNELNEKNAYITVNDKQYEIINKYTQDDLKEHIVYEDESVVVYDMLPKLTSIADMDFAEYLNILESDEYFSTISNEMPIPEEYLDLTGRLTFDWLIDIRKQLLESDNLIVKT